MPNFKLMVAAKPTRLELERKHMNLNLTGLMLQHVQMEIYVFFVTCVES